MVANPTFLLDQVRHPPRGPAEFPDDEASAKFMLSTVSMGNLTTQTLKAFTEGEYRKIVASL